MDGGDRLGGRLEGQRRTAWAVEEDVAWALGSRPGCGYMASGLVLVVGGAGYGSASGLK